VTFEWPSFQQQETPFAVNSIYDFSPASLGDLAAYFTANPFPVPIEQVTGFGATPRVLVDSGALPAAQASYDFTNITDSYFGLTLRYIARSDGAGTATAGVRLNMQFNGDAAANYHSSVAQRNFNVGAATVVWTNIIQNHGMNALSITAIPGTAVAQNSTPGAGVIEIPGYATSNFTTMATAKGALETDWTTDAGIYDILGVGHWASTAPITQITLSPNAGNFVAGSRFVLYGF
jgi:hypothetical protein